MNSKEVSFYALTIAGVVTLVALLILLFIYTKQRRSIKPVLWFFIVPIILLGWPSISTLVINADGVKVEKVVESIEKFKENPTPENKEEVEKAVETIEKSDNKSVEVLEKKAEAEHLIGKNKEASTTLKEIEKENPLSSEAQELKKVVILTEKLDKNIQLAETQPRNKKVLDSLKFVKIEAQNSNYKSPVLNKYIILSDEILKNKHTQ